jgi:hypothetical protein
MNALATSKGFESKYNKSYREYKENNCMEQDPNEQGQRYQEELQVMGEQLLAKVKELVHEGNVRRIIIKQDGRTIMEFPLTVGLVGVLVAPVLVAVGAIGALMAQCSIEVIRAEEPAANVQNKVNEVVRDEPPTP